MTTDEIERHITRVIEGLNTVETQRHAAKGYTFPADKWHATRRKKYFAIDCGTSGAFLCNASDGELFNIKAYGRPDKNKKQKADIGNITTVDPKELHARRYNYLNRRAE